MNLQKIFLFFLLVSSCFKVGNKCISALPNNATRCLSSKSVEYSDVLAIICDKILAVKWLKSFKRVKIKSFRSKEGFACLTWPVKLYALLLGHKFLSGFTHSRNPAVVTLRSDFDLKVTEVVTLLLTIKPII